MPINAGVSHVYKFGEQRVSLGLHRPLLRSRTRMAAPNGASRFTSTFLFPKK